MTAYSKGTAVTWTWGENKAHGKVAQSFTRPVTRTIKGTKVKRKASPDEPAYLIEQSDGDRVLTSHSELSKA